MHKYKKIPKTLKLKKRFERKVTKKKRNECWEWEGTLTTAGYGCLRYNYGHKKNTIFLAHRVSFALHKQEDLIKGLVVDHICRNRKCVNPDHLRQLSIIGNAMRDAVKVEPVFNLSVPTLLFEGVCNHGHKINSFDDLYARNRTSVRKIYYACKTCANIQYKNNRRNGRSS